MPPKSKFDSLVDFGKNVAKVGGEVLEKGKALAGNPEAKFNQSVKEKMRREGKTEDEAQRECLAGLASALQAESVLGVIDKKSQGYKEFRGALNTILSRKEMTQCKKDSESGFFRAPTGVSVTPDDIKNQESYFEQKYRNYGGSYVPDRKMVARHAAQTKNMEAILARLASGLTDGSIDLADLKTGGTPDSADIGKLLALKENMDRAESLHEFRLGGAKIMHAMWESAKTDITHNIWGDIRNMFASGFRLQPMELLFSASKLALDITLLVPKALAKGALNSLTIRPDKVIR